MKTLVIKQRVADFLRRHPPFESFTEADLLDLASCGKVKFHEAGEFICRQGQPKGQFVWVVQQGKVELLDQRASAETLRDVLGEGDVLGFDRFVGDGSWLHSARTDSDVILYGFEAERIESFLVRYPSMQRYLAAQLSIHDVYGSIRTSWLDADPPPATFLRSRFVALPPDATAAEATWALRSSPTGVIAAAHSDGRPIGIFTSSELQAVNGGVFANFATKCPTMSAEQLTIREAIREMLRDRSQAVLVTKDGTPESALESLVTSADLALFCGENPVGIVNAIRHSKSLAEIEPLWRQTDRLIRSALMQPADVDDCGNLSLAFACALADGCIGIAERQHAGMRAGLRPIPHCWAFLGASARGDRIGPHAPVLAAIYDDSDPAYVPEHGAYFDALLDAANASMRSCGPAGSVFNWPAGAKGSMPLSEWRTLYRDTIGNPFLRSLYDFRSFFDLRGIGGDRSLVAGLQDEVAADLRASEQIIFLLANDTLAQLPPLTFFQGLVLDIDGAQHESFNIDEAALIPVAAAARVFALGKRRLTLLSTVERLRAAALDFPEGARILCEASEAFRVAQYCRSLAGGSNIRPANLRKIDQLALKTAIGSIRDLLEFTAATFIPET